ncbi:MAG TPA: ATP-binding cassette domain-containing protein, partial [Parafilimonas sp.]|nr:ATP-binding cassette domain-containing protein [Parafilimonas sp.]
QSLMKKLDKLDRIENAELERPNLNINFKIDTQPGKILASLKHATKAFGENVIVENTSAEIDRGDKIALIGANGKGKSTVLRMLAGTEKFDGERNWGHNVDESFYAQHQLEALNLNHTILEELSTAGTGKTEQELRNLLGCFLFSGDEVEKKIKVLSGGEKARVALAKVIASKSNFLLLDEPTNHLDIHSVELLSEALNRYEGSYILVSHDRFFISKTANKIWEIVDHEIKEFKGGYEEYVEWKERMLKANSQRSTVDSQHKEKQENNNEELKIKNSKQKNQNITEIQKLQKQLKKLEDQIENITKEKLQIEEDLAKPEFYSDKNKFLQLENSYKSVQQKLAASNKDYEVVFEKLIELEN